jgi:hypothetical protein
MSNRVPFTLTTARLGISALSTVITLGACSHQEDAGPAAPQTPGTPAAPAAVLVEPPPAPATAAAAAPTGPQAPQLDPPVVLKDVGFKTPESVFYDAEQDLYLVSNINGKPLDVDGNGFISKVSPEGKVVELMWIDGSKKASSMNAPKGLAAVGNVLYVADINFVRMFDRKTGAAKGKIAIPGATFLNDISAAPDGTLYVTDSGLKMGKDILEGNGTDAIYKIVKGTRVEKVIADKEFGKPNGILADDKGGVWTVTFGSGELIHIDNTGKKEPGQKMPAGTLDGIVKLGDGTMLVSSWAASAIFRGTPGGTFETIIHDVKSPADIGYDTKRNVVLVPLFQADSVVLQKLPGVAPSPSAPAPVAATPATPGAVAPAAAAPKPAPKGPAAAPPSAPAGTHATPMSAPVGAPATPATPATPPAKAATPPAPVPPATPAAPAKAAAPPSVPPAATAPKK